jgi:hypothetical protein
MKRIILQTANNSCKSLIRKSIFINKIIKKHILLILKNNTMKKTILKTAAILLVMAGMIIACGKENNESNEPIALKGTKWKLTGIVDVQTGVLKELEPKDCERCYTLEFKTDSVAYGYSVLNETCLTLSSKPIMGCMTEIGDSHIGDAQLFYDVIQILDSCTITKNELKFFYNEKKKYLLYKLVQP